jgi:UDP-N-acetylglucosamine 2-epimerase (non-hydrolysing)
MENNLPIYFVLGTRAQFIKVAPTMRKMQERGIPYTLIYTAQHRENIEEILEIYKLPAPEMVMYERGEANTKSSFLRWFISILYKILFQPKRYIPRPGVLLTHGDTFTAWLAALMGRRTNCKVAHIESGCRSFNIFSPFPEELSRLLTFKLTDIFFCADEWTLGNLKKYRGIKINMGANTMLDGVRYALEYPLKSKFGFEDARFAIVSVHRYENIFTSRFTTVILPILQNIAKEHRLIFTLHPTTRERLLTLGLFHTLSENPNIILHERFSFVDWIDLCNKAEFVITDGGSNQEELSYLGVPTLLFRNESERREGLGQNIVISKFDMKIIDEFVQKPEKYRREPSIGKYQPSEAIIKAVRALQDR